MWGAREKIVATMVDDVVFFKEKGDVTGLSNGVAAEVDDTRRKLVKQTADDVGMEASTRRIDDDGFVWGDVVEGLLAGCQDGLGVFAKLGDVAAHFADGVFVDFDQGDVVAADG